MVLYFYPKDGTPGCTIEAHNFQRDQPQYSQRNAVVVGVSVDTTDSHKEFCSKEGLNFKLLADTEHKVVKQYDSTMNYKGVEIAARNTFIIDPQGKIERAYTSVDPNKHSQEVLAALDELLHAVKVICYPEQDGGRASRPSLLVHALVLRARAFSPAFKLQV